METATDIDLYCLLQEAYCPKFWVASWHYIFVYIINAPIFTVGRYPTHASRLISTIYSRTAQYYNGSLFTIPSSIFIRIKGIVGVVLYSSHVRYKRREECSFAQKLSDETSLVFLQQKLSARLNVLVKRFGKLYPPHITNGLKCKAIRALYIFRIIIITSHIYPQHDTFTQCYIMQPNVHFYYAADAGIGVLFCMRESMTQKLTHAYIIVMALHRLLDVSKACVFSTGTYLLFKKSQLFVLLNLIQHGIYKRFKYIPINTHNYTVATILLVTLRYIIKPKYSCIRVNIFFRTFCNFLREIYL